MGEIVLISYDVFNEYYQLWERKKQSNSANFITENPDQIWILENLSKSMTVSYDDVPKLDVPYHVLREKNISKVNKWIEDNDVGKIVAIVFKKSETKKEPKEIHTVENVHSKKTITKRNFFTGKEKTVEKDIIEMRPVKKTVIENTRYIVPTYRFHFESEENALLFKLTWL